MISNLVVQVLWTYTIWTSGLVRVKWWNFLWGDRWLSFHSPFLRVSPWKHDQLSKRPDLSILQCKIMGLLTSGTVNTYLRNHSLPRCTGENDKVHPFISQWERRNCYCFFLSLHCINLYATLSILYSHFYPILHVCKSDNAYFLIIVPILFYIDMDESFVGKIVFLPQKPIAAF